MQPTYSPSMHSTHVPTAQLCMATAMYDMILLTARGCLSKAKTEDSAALVAFDIGKGHLPCGIARIEQIFSRFSA